MLLLLAACGATPEDNGAEAPVDLVASLVEPGPYRVGYRESVVTYSDDVSTDRALRLALWFPTEATAGGPAAYLGGAIEAPDVLDDPPPLAGALPVVLYSHGHQGYAEASSFLAEHLASHGYAVAAPDHTGNTTFDGADRETEIYLRRPRDLSAALDALPDELDVDADAAVVTGHSFGGYTALALAGAAYDPAGLAACTPDTSSFCSTMSETLSSAFLQGLGDTRIVSAVSMAAGDFGLFGADGVGSVDVPVLLLTGELDSDDGDAYWSALRGGADRRVDIVGAGHQAFTDFSGVLPDGGTIAPEEGFRVVRAYTLAAVRAGFGDASVAPVLDGERTVSEAAVLFR